MTLSDLLIRAVHYGVIVVEAWAVIDCLVRPTAAFVAAGKLTKPAWLAITILALFTGYFLVASALIGNFALAGVIAAIIYLVDVRPAVREVQGGGGRW